jgi:hypothetical protein
MSLRSYVEPAAFDRTVASRFGAALAFPQLLSRVSELPVALWATSDADLDAASDPRVRVVLCADAGLAGRMGARGVFVPARLHAVEAMRPFLPVTRARVRRARGLPARAVVVADDTGASWCGRSIPDDLVDTVLACASAVVARGEVVLRAMAWAAPVVTDRRSAARVGAVLGRDVLEGVGPDDPVVQALLDDDALATEYAWRGRRCYERRDLDRVAVTVVRRLGCMPTRTDRIAACSRELGSGSESPTLARAYDLLAAVTD